MKHMASRLLPAAFLAAASFTSPVAADSEMEVETVEGWTIVRSLDSLACVMEKVNEEGYLLRVGKTEAGAHFGYVAVYTRDDSINIIGGVTNDIILDMDGNRYTAAATGDFRDGGYRGGYVKVNNPAFADDLARKYVMTINPDGDNPIKIDLDGTFKAMAATRDCEHYSLAVQSVTDPDTRTGLVTASLSAWASLLAQSDRAKGLSESAVAALVFPEVTKFGLGVGGEGGNGVLFKGDDVAGFYRTSSISVGAQAGLQSYGYAVMFMTQDALDTFQSESGFELGVDGSVTVIETGVTAEVDTTNLKSEIVAFVFDEEGLMANWTVEGTRIRAIE